jgi:hypothetical protein
MCQALVKRLRWRFPVERFARSGIQGGSDGGDCVWAMRAEIRSLGELLAQQPIGVFVGTALPWALGVAEANLDARINFELGMLRHFRALVPSERPSQRLWQGHDSAGDRVSHRLRAVSGERRAILDARRVTMTFEAWQGQ